MPLDITLESKHQCYTHYDGAGRASYTISVPSWLEISTPLMMNHYEESLGRPVLQTQYRVDDG